MQIILSLLMLALASQAYAHGDHHKYKDAKGGPLLQGYPGYSLVSVKGTYHWHPIHTTKPICVEVWTPPCVPNEKTGYGFQCHN
jgi:hypothetical protein